MSNLMVNSWRVLGGFVVWMLAYAAGAANMARADGALYWVHMVAMAMLVCLVATEKRQRGE